MYRRTFLTGTAAAAALAVTGAAPALAAQGGLRDTATLTLLTAAADAQAQAILTGPPMGGMGGMGGMDF